MVKCQHRYNKEKTVLEIDGINYFAVIIAWLVNMFIGAYWYSPAGFSKQWKQYTKIDLMKLPKSEANQAISYVAISALIQAFVLALVLNSLLVTTIADGIATAVVLWAGLVAATTIGATFYSRRGWKFWWLNSSYFLLVMTINACILTVWK
jgi:Protein of unknown function (DUF1761)